MKSDFTSPVRSPAAMLFTVVVAALLTAGCSSRDQGPVRVVLVSIDTCRADHLSVYGYGRPTTPYLEELAARGVLFTRAFSQVPDTTPSHASLFTSEYPSTHQSANGVPLDGRFDTLAERLQERGYRTAAFVSGWTMTADASGLQQGFDVYDDTMTARGSATAKEPNERPAAATTDAALAWLEDHADDPFFLFVHYFDPHGRYYPPQQYREQFRAVRPAGRPPRRLPPGEIPPYARIQGETDYDVYVSMYDGEIRYVDDQIRRIGDALRRHGVSGRTLFIVTGDHGEGLGEHGLFFAHGWRLYDTDTRVPLLFAMPGALPSGQSVSGLAQSIDVMPTVLDVLGIDAAGALPGRSLLAAMKGDETPPNRFVLSRTTKGPTYLETKMERDIQDHWALRTPDWKYLHSTDGSSRLLFDLQSDPTERKDVLGQYPDRARELQTLLEHTLSEMNTQELSVPTARDPDERARILERLRELGYIR